MELAVSECLFQAWRMHPFATALILVANLAGVPTFRLGDVDCAGINIRYLPPIGSKVDGMMKKEDRAPDVPGVVALLALQQ